MIDIENSIKKVSVSKKFKNEKENFQQEIRVINTEFKRKKSLLISLYDNYLEGMISEQEYLYGKNKYEKEKEKLKNKLDELQIQIRKFEDTYTENNKCISNIILKGTWPLG
jgi:site-specific DNA recombinase